MGRKVDKTGASDWKNKADIIAIDIQIYSLGHSLVGPDLELSQHTKISLQISS